ncbi:MAG TPA: DUF1345 domain-containing protein [Bauldia sp.]|nr:DUF1345 domain-containing protein [Bauldia sp.]
MESGTRLGWIARIGRVVTGWPRLFIAAGVGVAVTLASLSFGALPTTAALVGWDIGLIVFFATLAELMITADTAEIRRHAARQDVGQFVVLTLSALAALASVVAIYAEVSRAGEGAIADWRLALGVVTIVLSWFFVQSMFAVHYAHEYYGSARGEGGGLTFPGGRDEPDYWDFAYFSLVIGMSAQVSDVAVTGRRLRRTVTVHAIVAFWFNVAVLALLINIAADAIRS